MYKDEVKAEEKAPTELEELKAGYDEKIDELKSCLRNKDRRLTKVEKRWSLFIGVLCVLGMLTVSVLLFLTMYHVHENLPQTITDTKDYSSASHYIVSDWWLLIGSLVIDVSAFVGLFTGFYVLYWWFTKKGQ